MTNLIQQKIELLEDFCIIEKHNDPRRRLVRKALRQCGTELHMEQMLYDVLRGTTTIENVLAQRGFIV